MIIVAADKRTQSGGDSLPAILGEELIADARFFESRDRIRVCGINGAMGLEAAVVFVIGAANLLGAEKDYHLPEEARADRFRDNTRRLYMAFTRAAQKLGIT